MCGLVGAVGALELPELTALSYLGTLSSLRGNHSTGLMDFLPDAKEGKTVNFDKLTDDPSDFFSPRGRYFKHWMKTRWKTSMPTVIGVHTRYATVGAINEKNAHPFNHGRILGMHNGTIRNDFEFREKFDTDSEAIYYNISKKGDTFLEDLEGMWGTNAAYALVYFDLKAKELVFYRNAERPLYFFVTHLKDAMFWASDRTWLESVLPYFNIRGTIEVVPVDTKIAFDLSVDPDAIVKSFNSKKISGRRWLQPWRNETGGNITTHVKKWYPEHGRYLTPPELEEYLEEQDKLKANAGSNVHKIEDWYRGYNNVYIERRVYKKVLEEGCQGCNRKVPLHEQIEFVARDKYLCKNCKSDGIIRRLVTDELAEEAAANAGVH